MTVRIVVQARTSSSRLPAKVLLPLGGFPLAVLVAMRAGNTGIPVVIATSEETDDDLLADTIVRQGISLVRGSLEDPLSRFVHAVSDMQDSDIVVRLTADNPVPDGDLIQKLILRVGSESPYAQIGGGDQSLPYGLSAEAFLVGALRRADLEGTRSDHREHVTVWMREHLNTTSVSAAELDAKWNPRHSRCTVDTLHDYLRVARIFAKIQDPVHSSWGTVLDEIEQDSNHISLVPQGSVKSTGIQQSKLILGTAQLGSAYGATNGLGMLTDSQVSSVLRSASGHGFSHVDTARAYGTSERRIGNATKGGRFSPLGVVTKIMPLDSLNSDSSADLGTSIVRASALESLLELKTEQLSALLVHRAEDWFKPGVKRGLLDLRDSGLTNTIGASIAEPSSLKPLLEDPDLGYIQLPFNMIDRRWSAQDTASLFKSRPDVTFTVRSVFLQGLLTGSSVINWPKNFGVSVRHLHDVIEEAVQSVGKSSKVELALSYVLAHDWVDSVVVGAETMEQVAELATFSAAPPLTPAEVQTVAGILTKLQNIVVDPSKWEFA